MQTRVGTCNFKTITHAIRYYRGQGYEDAEKAVAQKIAAKEIEIGAASLRGKLFDWDSDGRAYYWD